MNGIVFLTKCSVICTSRATRYVLIPQYGCFLMSDHISCD